jgi:hypothetical protein
VKSQPEKPDELAFRFDRVKPSQFFLHRMKNNSVHLSKVDGPALADPPKWLFGGRIRTVAQ